MAEAKAKGKAADYGECPSKKETYFGYKVHALITLEGFITAFDITPASADDRDGLREMVELPSLLTKVMLGSNSPIE